MNNVKKVESLDSWFERQTNKSKKAKAKVQVLAIKSEILDGLDKGYTIRTLHQYFYEVGKVTCSYETFRFQTNQFLKVKIKKDEQSNLTETPTEIIKKKTISIKEKGFEFSPIPDPDELY